MIVKNIHGWWNGTVKKPTDDRTMPDIPKHSKCLFCDGQENKYIGVTKAMRMKLKDNLLVATDKISSDVWQIKYCPMCGRKLNDGKAYSPKTQQKEGAEK